MPDQVLENELFTAGEKGSMLYADFGARNYCLRVGYIGQFYGILRDNFVSIWYLLLCQVSSSSIGVASSFMRTGRGSLGGPYWLATAVLGSLDMTLTLSVMR